MCGLIGAFNTGPNKTPVNEAVLHQFENQQERGVKGFGIIKIDDKMEWKVDRATEGFKFMYDIHQDPVRAMIMHHRIPTSSDNKMEQTHPLLVDNDTLKHNYLLIHNGVVSNDDELKEEHEKLGFVYKTIDKDGTWEKYNDSECVAIEVARFIEGQTGMVGIQGSAAFICLQINRKTNKVMKLFFGRNDSTSPLNMAKTRNKLFLSSTGPGTEVKPFKLYECKIDADMKLASRKMTFKAPKTYPVSLFNTTGQIKNNLAPVDYDDYGDGYGCSRGSIKSYPAGKSIEPVKKEFVPGVDDDDEELGDVQDKIVILTEDYIPFIQSTLDRFIDNLYDADTVMEVDEKTIENTIDDIRMELEDMVKKAAEIHKAQALADAVMDNTIGFKANEQE